MRRSPVSRFAILITLLVLVPFQLSLLAQRPPTRTPSPPSMVDIRLRVTMDGPISQNTIPQFTRVELMSGTNTFVRQGFTDDMGQAEFRSCDPGNYRFRISGDGLETKLTDVFNVSPYESVHYEQVSVARLKDPNISQQPKGSGTNTVSTAEMNVPENAAREFRRGVEAMEGQHWDKAQEHLEKAVAEYPNYPTAYNNLGVVYMQQDQNEKGAKAFERAVELDPKYAKAELNLAKIRFSQKNLPGSEALLRSALTTDPANPEIYVMLANVLLVRGDYPGAVENARKVHTLDHGKLAVAHYIAARGLQAQHKDSEAATELKIFLQEAPADPLATQARTLLAQLETH